MRHVITALLGASVLSIACAPGAFAADIPTKMPVKAPMAVGVPWTGFYVNGGIGYGAWAADTTTVDPATGICVLCVTQVQGGKGWLATLGAGYDYQFTSKIVAGLFGDASISSLKGTIQDDTGGPGIAGDIKQTSSWAFGARAGWLLTPRTLSYFNGGYTGARFSGTNMVSTINGAATGFSTPAFTANGWFLGGGVEMSLSPGWFWRSEYRYSYYGSKTITDTNGAGAAQSSITFKPAVQTVTTQVVYKFNGGLPAPVYPAAATMATNWTGFYVNGGGGYGVWAADTTTANLFGVCQLCVTQVQGGKGYLGRAGAGFDWQFSPAWVVGVFGDADISSLKGTINDQTIVAPGEIKQTSAWAVGPRLGWLASPQTLAYVNGGYTRAHFTGSNLLFAFNGAPSVFSLQASSYNGWFLGGGVETSFDLLGKGWFWRNEYRYASYANKTLLDTNSTGGFADSINFKPKVQTVVSEIVFKFN